MTLLTLMAKEYRLLLRDLHGLALLFIMPSVFVLIMSFALDSSFRDTPPVVRYALQTIEDSPATTALAQALRRQYGPSVTLPAGSEEVMLRRGDVHLLVRTMENFSVLLEAGETAAVVKVSPDISPAELDRFTGFLYQQFGALMVEQLLTYMGEDSAVDFSNSVQLESVQEDVEHYKRPSSTQQNVPAWLLFAMFFITVPLSNTLIGERAQGTLARLASIGVSRWQILAGKVLPYFFLNLMQVATMLAIGFWLMPALGGEALSITGSVSALVVIAISASMAAISYAMLIATLAQTTEQATLMTGVCNLIMAALGGVMVPTFVMPVLMQRISEFSPMAWGLQGFLDVILREAQVMDVLPEAGLLAGFAILLSGIVVVLGNE